LCLIFTSFTSTDLITPGWITEKYVDTYSVKAVFSIIIWVKLIVDLMTKKQFECVEEEDAKKGNAVSSLA
ncbi:MAG TPA: hypothetical protein VLJ41_01400, partial [Segetibacter sp.]|nr:hypothetical protein [Segetibacter sp.]